jgi:hypothetical protein
MNTHTPRCHGLKNQRNGQKVSGSLRRTLSFAHAGPVRLRMSATGNLAASSKEQEGHTNRESTKIVLRIMAALRNETSCNRVANTQRASSRPTHIRTEGRAAGLGCEALSLLQRPLHNRGFSGIRAEPLCCGPSCRGDGGPKVENLCACFRCFVAFILPVSPGGWKEQKQPQPEGTRPALSVVRGLNPKIFCNLLSSYTQYISCKNTHNGLYKRRM